MAANLNVFKKLSKNCVYANRKFFSEKLIKLGVMKNQLRKEKKMTLWALEL